MVLWFIPSSCTNTRVNMQNTSNDLLIKNPRHIATLTEYLHVAEGSCRANLLLELWQCLSLDQQGLHHAVQTPEWVNNNIRDKQASKQGISALFAAISVHGFILYENRKKGRRSLNLYYAKHTAKKANDFPKAHLLGVCCFGNVYGRTHVRCYILVGRGTDIWIEQADWNIKCVMDAVISICSKEREHANRKAQRLNRTMG